MTTGKWKESPPVRVRNASGVDVWVYRVPFGDEVDRREMPIGLNYGKTAELAGRDFLLLTLGKYRDRYTCSGSTAGDLWAILLEPLEPERNEWGDVSP